MGAARVPVTRSAEVRCVRRLSPALVDAVGGSRGIGISPRCSRANRRKRTGAIFFTCLGTRHAPRLRCFGSFLLFVLAPDSARAGSRADVSSPPVCSSGFPGRLSLSLRCSKAVTYNGGASPSPRPAHLSEIVPFSTHLTNMLFRNSFAATSARGAFFLPAAPRRDE